MAGNVFIFEMIIANRRAGLAREVGHVKQMTRGPLGPIGEIWFHGATSCSYLAKEEALPLK